MEGWKEGDIYIDMSTNLPALLRKVAADAGVRGVSVLDAPVSGGTIGAEKGTLSIMVGGDATVLDKVRNILEPIGKNIFHLGEIGCGNIAKLVNNMIAASCTAATAECFVLGVKAGIDAKKLWNVVHVSSGNSFVMENSCLRTLAGDFEPGFRVNLMLKDIRLALDLAKENDVPLPVSASVEQQFVETKAAGYGEKSISSIILPMESLAGVQVRGKM